MTFIKSVPSKFFNEAEEIRCLRFRKTFFFSPHNELLTKCRYGFILFLTNCLDARIRTRQLNTTKAFQNSHHLLLVNHNPMSFFKNIFHNGMRVLCLLTSMLHCDVIVNHATLEWTRAIQSIYCNNVQKMIRLHPLQQVSNATTF